MTNSHNSHTVATMGWELLAATSQMFPSGAGGEPNGAKTKQDIGLTFIRWQQNGTLGKS